MDFTNQELARIAKEQKFLLSIVAANIILFILIMHSSLGLGAVIVQVISAILNIIAVVSLIMSMKKSFLTGLCISILTIPPFVGILVLLIVNGRATKILKNHNIKVGLFGAGKKAIAELEREA